MSYIPDITSWELNLAEAFTIGAKWEIDNQIDVLSGDCSLVRSDISLVKISDVAPIPEPSTMLLVATGLIGLVGFRKKFKK